MTTSTEHASLSRAIGRVEGEMSGMKDDISDMKQILQRIDGRLAKLEAKENQRRGAMAVIATIGGFIGAGIVKLWPVIWGVVR